MGSHSLSAGKRGWESCTDASQQGSTAEPQHCWAGSINRITNTLSREAQNGMKELEALLFNTHWKQAEQCLRTTYSSMPASLPWKKINKRLSGFSFWYQSNTRQTTRWQQTVLDMNIFCFWCILLKSCGSFFSLSNYHLPCPLSNDHKWNTCQLTAGNQNTAKTKKNSLKISQGHSSINNSVLWSVICIFVIGPFSVLLTQKS